LPILTKSSNRSSGKLARFILFSLGTPSSHLFSLFIYIILDLADLISFLHRHESRTNDTMSSFLTSIKSHISTLKWSTLIPTKRSSPVIWFFISLCNTPLPNGSSSNTNGLAYYSPVDDLNAICPRFSRTSSRLSPRVAK